MIFNTALNKLDKKNIWKGTYGMVYTIIHWQPADILCIEIVSNSCTINVILLEIKDATKLCLCIIRVWLLFCSVRVSISLHFLPILFVKLGFQFLNLFSSQKT